mmetsp:Transcript_147728/g.257600  ORF Transcript_147728/g.257600 Transcript_147728/m.257600 type:complete len:215 (-) Transcript_147728:337-981(-)
MKSWWRRQLSHWPWLWCRFAKVHAHTTHEAVWCVALGFHLVSSVAQSAARKKPSATTGVVCVLLVKVVFNPRIICTLFQLAERPVSRIRSPRPFQNVRVLQRSLLWMKRWCRLALVVSLLQGGLFTTPCSISIILIWLEKVRNLPGSATRSVAGALHDLCMLLLFSLPRQVLFRDTWRIRRCCWLRWCWSLLQAVISSLQMLRISRQFAQWGMA